MQENEAAPLEMTGDPRELLGRERARLAGLERTIAAAEPKHYWRSEERSG
jgi:hypothetical protein